MISRSTNIRAALKSRQRGFIMRPDRFASLGDPAYSFVVALLHGDGADASTTFTDNSSYARTFTPGGSAQIDTAQSVFGGASMLFDGTNSYITAADATEFSLGTQNFVVEGRVRFNSLTGTQYFFGQCESTGLNTSLSVAIAKNSSNNIEAFTCEGAAVRGLCISTTTVVANTWYAFCYERSGNKFDLRINGLLEATFTIATNVNNSAGGLSLGRLGDFNGLYFNGWLDEFRFTINQARYTVDYTPAAVPFPDF